ncbi:bifunctional 5,10-methylenetetrahydrofolate dehydrogenase/5,10-methenyltetrahydrofolate cyclohydrolase [Dehalococcoidia bacterium]|nr:bifunctional 5,10-methylenetetrahydrofolate dehydrogenase/5,10-methenyltetrahydrofolate cyclohydrolase [Dehalococcoidia bacterium]
MKILDGKKLSERIIADLKKKIKKSNLKVRLVVIQVGENLVSQIFINQKKIACQKTGIDFQSYKFSAKTSSLEFKKAITRIVKNPINSGVIIQLPLPKRFEGGIEQFLNLIPEEKDIDVLSEKSLGKFYQGTLKILPPTVNGILYLLKNYKIKLKGKNVVVIGAGRLVGFPLAVQLLKEKATLSVLNEFTKDTPSFTKKADILISGVGKPNLIKGNIVKRGVVIIDAGTSLEKGKLSGDVDLQSVSKKASYITPVPGGVGPLTVAYLLENLVKLNKR